MQNNKTFCHDCRKEIEIENEELKNGKMLIYDNGEGKITIAKCDDCFTKNQSLTNFQECEVYSRVVGYYRPVQQWNKGKQQEYKDRNEYVNP